MFNNVKNKVLKYSKNGQFNKYLGEMYSDKMMLWFSFQEINSMRR